jgi:WXG100 family type VII secretion target
MTDEIRADYEEMEQIATRFSTQSQAIQQMMQKVRGSMEKLENGDWIGRGSDAFFNEMNSDILPAVQRLVEALEEGGRTTKDIAQTVQQAEEEASSRFRI